MKVSTFTIEMPDSLLKAIHALAEEEGVTVESLVQEAFSDLLAKRKEGSPRKHALQAFESSLEQYDAVYEILSR
jgi:hypothetical protein